MRGLVAQAGFGLRDVSKTSPSFRRLVCFPLDTREGRTQDISSLSLSLSLSLSPSLSRGVVVAVRRASRCSAVTSLNELRRPLSACESLSLAVERSVGMGSTLALHISVARAHQESNSGFRGSHAHDREDVVQSIVAVHQRPVDAAVLHRRPARECANARERGRALSLSAAGAAVPRAQSEEGKRVSQNDALSLSISLSLSLC